MLRDKNQQIIETQSRVNCQPVVPSPRHTRHVKTEAENTKRFSNDPQTADFFHL